MTDQALFGRTYAVALTDAPGNPGAQYGNAGNDPSPLRVSFDIERNNKGTPNKATISIYNLSPQTRGNIGKGTLITLSAGYGSLVGNLFLGVVVRPEVSRQGPDIITKLECGDGEAALAHSKINQTFPANPPTQLADILRACAEAMSLTTPANPSGMNAGIALGIPVVTFPRGYVANGMVADVLNDLCKPRDLRWSIQNNALEIVPRGAHAGVDAVVLESDTGLIGIPSLNGKQGKFSALLNPQIAPNRLVRVSSLADKRVNGFYKIQTAHYIGDSHDAKWQVDCEATLMPDAQAQTLPAASGFNYVGDPQAVV